MLPDIGLKDYYLQYINDAKVDIYKYNEELKICNKLKEETYNYIVKYKNKLINDYNLNLDDYIEWKTKEYNDTQSLSRKVNKILNENENDANRIIFLQLAKYCGILKNEDKLNTLKKLADKRKDIKFGKYRELVNKYYTKVHKCVLEGMGYKFGYGIGTYCCNRWKFVNSNPNKRYLDYPATAAKRKELLNKGIKLYDEKEAEWYKVRNIPYDGVDYRVYTTNTHYYEFTFINSCIFKSNNLEYKRTEYIHLKYRGKSYKEIADDCKTIEDIYNQNVDIKYKLNMLLYKDPNKYLNFIRNAEQNKYRTYNSKNR